MKRIPRIRAWTVSALAAGLGMAALAGSPASASASMLNLFTQNTCAATSTGQAFSQWGDSSYYMMMPGGSFAGSAPGWTLTGGARVVSDSAPWNLNGYAPSGSLYLPAGATAQSPFICVDPQDPTYRLLQQQGNAYGSMGVQAVYRSLLGAQLAITLSPVDATASWSPTGTLPTAAAPASLISDGTAQMSLRFTAGPGGAYIDDVFVDPLMHR